MIVEYLGYSISINDDLLKSQKATKNLYEIILIRQEIKALLLLEDEYEPKELLEDLTKLEYKLQETWNFPQDPNYHSYQWQLKNCTCSKLDNFDLLGTELSVVNINCPYHGKENKKDEL